MATPQALPGFWIFMYRVSPFTYLISGMLSTAVGGASVHCSDAELLTVNPPAGQTCAEYLDPFVSELGGALLNGVATADCHMCPISSTDAFLAGLNISAADAWRNFGLMWVYIVFNVVVALLLYWLGRVPKRWSRKRAGAAGEGVGGKSSRR